MELLCLTSTANSDEDPHSEGRYLAWIPTRPIGTKLSKSCFSQSVRIYRQKLEIDSSSGTYGYILKPQSSILKSFCLAPVNTGVHLRIVLDRACRFMMNRCDGLYIYALATSGHALLRHTKHRGVCFMIERCREKSLDVRYECGLTIDLCWKDHDGNDCNNPVLPADRASSWNKIAINIGKRILKRFSIPKLIMSRGIQGNESWYKPTFRRPPNAGNWGFGKTPVWRLWYITAIIIWAFLTLALFTPAYLGQIQLSDPTTIFPTLGILSAVIGIPLATYFTLKYFLAHRYWLRSYLEYKLPGWLTIFSYEHTLTMSISNSSLFRGLVYRWKIFSRPRQDRWQRVENDLYEPESLDPRKSHGSYELHESLNPFDLTEGMELHTVARAESDIFYVILGEKYAKVLSRLKAALASTSESIPSL
jgi:hypothetical protein